MLAPPARSRAGADFAKGLRLSFSQTHRARYSALGTMEQLTVLSLFEYGCAAHSGSLVVQSALWPNQYSAHLRQAIRATDFFALCSCARALHASTVVLLSQPGRRIGCPKAYSYVRWAGDAVLFSADEDDPSALRHTVYLVPTLGAPSSSLHV